MPRGWFGESGRHSLAAKGIRTGRKDRAAKVARNIRKEKEMTFAEMEKMGVRFWAGKDRTYYLRRYPHLGKFEGGYLIDQYIYEMAGEAGHYIGDIETTGLATPMKFDPLLVSDVEEAIKKDGDYLRKEEREFLLGMAGAIVIEDSQGFVDIDYFEDKNELQAAIKKLEKEYEEFYEEHEEEDF